MRIILAISLLISFLCISAQAETLRVVTLHAPPYGYEQAGRATGMTVEVVRETLARMNIDSEILIVPWKRALHMVREGEADAIFNAVWTRERSTYLHYSDEPMILESTVAFKRTRSPLKLGADFSGADTIVMGIGSGFSYGPEIDAMLARKPFAKVLEAPTIERNIRKLIIGRIDAFFGDREAVLYSAKQMRVADQLEIIRDDTNQEIVFGNSDTFMAFSKKTMKPDIARRFSETLRSMKQDGTYDAIVTRFQMP